jgi:hypothetical protein
MNPEQQMLTQVFRQENLHSAISCKGHDNAGFALASAKNRMRLAMEDRLKTADRRSIDTAPQDTAPAQTNPCTPVRAATGAVKEK